jgi:hypothetical protein
MKRIALFCLLVSLLVGSAWGSISATRTGDWSDDTVWNKGYVPLDVGGEEIKIGDGDGITVTVNATQLNYSTQKIDTARDNTLAIVSGGYIGDGREMHIGDAGMSSSGTDIGYLDISGGQLEMTASGKLQIGYKAGGDGRATISGGTLNGSGKIYVGCSSASGSRGLLKVLGNAATISMGGEMYIANDSSSSSGNLGKGKVWFDENGDGDLSKIQVSKLIIDSQGDAAAEALLYIDAATLPNADVVLIESTGTSSITGKFDSVVMNGKGTAIMDLTGTGGHAYLLSYMYDAGASRIDSHTGNDVALVLIPEPATLLLLGIGGLIAAKRRKR